MSTTLLAERARRLPDSARARSPRRPSRNASRWRSGARGTDSPSSARPAQRDLPRRARDRRRRARRAGAPGRRDRRRSRPPRAAPAGTRSSTSGQAAISRSTPLLTISLPTNATSSIALGIEPLQRRPRRRARRGRTRCVRVLRAGSARPSARRRAASARTPAAARRGLAGAKRATSTPGGPEPRARARAPDRRAPATGWRRCDGSRRAPRARAARPSRARPRKRSGLAA